MKIESPKTEEIENLCKNLGLDKNQKIAKELANSVI